MSFQLYLQVNIWNELSLTIKQSGFDVNLVLTLEHEYTISTLTSVVVITLSIHKFNGGRFMWTSL